MRLLNKIIFIFFLLFSTFSFAEISFVQRVLVEKSGTAGVDNDGFFGNGVAFNDDGSKMFVVFNASNTQTYSHVSEYNLSKGFDISTSIFAGDNEKCRLNTNDETTGPVSRVYGLKFSKDGMKLFVGRGALTDGADHDRIFGFELSSPFDVSTCSFSDNQTSGLDSDALQNGSNAGDITALGDDKVTLQGFDISKDGTKLFAIFHSRLDVSKGANTRLLEYTMSTPFDLTTISLVTSGGIELEDETQNPNGLVFSPDGTRLWTLDHQNESADVTQISLNVAYSTSSFTIDGTVDIEDLNGLETFDEPRGIAFSTSGLKMYVGTDQNNPEDDGGEHMNEIDLVCPFNIVSSASCKSYTSKGRTGVAEAQAELAKRTITLSTNSALNRLKWIRRNKDKDNLSNQNIKINFSNSLLSSLKQLPISSFKNVSTNQKKNNSDKKYFHWTEGSVSIGRTGDTKISTPKRFEVSSLSFGFDKLTDKKGIYGYVFRYGNDHIDVGTFGSEVDAETLNFTYYSSTPMQNNKQYIDKIFGIGKIKSDILTVVDNKKFTADRNGNQIYGTLKIKDEIKKNTFTFIPSAQFDIGHTLLDGYEESGQGNGAYIVDDQHVRTKNLRAALAAVQDLSNDKYTVKRHGKIEYQVDIDRSSNFNYKLLDAKEVVGSETLHSGSLHNINGELGLDIVLPDKYSLFIIYERNQAINSGHTDNIHIAFGYLPYEGAEYAFTINGSENLLSKLEFKKNVDGLNLSFNVKDDITNLGDNREANIVLNKVF